jgi:hypothetical protein
MNHRAAAGEPDAARYFEREFERIERVVAALLNGSNNHSRQIHSLLERVGSVERRVAANSPLRPGMPHREAHAAPVPLRPCPATAATRTYREGLSRNLAEISRALELAWIEARRARPVAGSVGPSGSDIIYEPVVVDGELFLRQVRVVEVERARADPPWVDDDEAGADEDNDA